MRVVNNIYDKVLRFNNLLATQLKSGNISQYDMHVKLFEKKIWIYKKKEEKFFALHFFFFCLWSVPPEKKLKMRVFIFVFLPVRILPVFLSFSLFFFWIISSTVWKKARSRLLSLSKWVFFHACLPHNHLKAWSNFIQQHSLKYTCLFMHWYWTWCRLHFQEKVWIFLIGRTSKIMLMHLIATFGSIANIW